MLKRSVRQYLLLIVWYNPQIIINYPYRIIHSKVSVFSMGEDLSRKEREAGL